ncbi:MAG: ubiquinone/menaquinone biosynthesis methyltransferase [Anaerolineales bacterium]|nr:ubiquinone/menaquinone biosynthesis methyltransferase [Anaerolineales bacterium]
MTHLSGSARARYVQGMFGRIAARYDLMNRLMTGGQDVRWRQQVIDLAGLPAGGRLLDLGTGTGDLALEALGRDGAMLATGGDFTLEMMRVGRQRPGGARVRWAGMDALDLPFDGGVFDAVISGYLMRNVVDVRRAWAEQYRVLQPGGRVVCLDTTPPPRGWQRPFINLHMHIVIPALGRLITGASDAYRYLPESTEGFLPAEQLADHMAAVGFREVGYCHLMLGTMAIHWGTKPGDALQLAGPVVAESYGPGKGDQAW